MTILYQSVERWCQRKQPNQCHQIGHFIVQLYFQRIQLKTSQLPIGVDTIQTITKIHTGFKVYLQYEVEETVMFPDVCYKISCKKNNFYWISREDEQTMVQ